MPKTTLAPNLIAGPYTPPPAAAGDSLRCAIEGRVNVAGVTAAPIPWPYHHQRQGGKRRLIVTPVLVRAIKTEGAQTLADALGVSRWTVSRWRRALGVPRFNAGTLATWRQLAPARLHGQARGKGGRATGDRRKTATSGK